MEARGGSTAYDPSVRKGPVVVVIVLAAAGVLMAVAPFDRPQPSGLLISGSPSCPAPIVSAWRHEHRSSWWFGYAPLTSTPSTALGFSRFAVDQVSIPTAVESCAEAARRRLAYAALLAGPGVLVWFLRRRRFDPPANPNPNLAT
jgi:hypothetical protein